MIFKIIKPIFSPLVCSTCLYKTVCLWRTVCQAHLCWTEYGQWLAGVSLYFLCDTALDCVCTGVRLFCGPAARQHDASHSWLNPLPPTDSILKHFYRNLPDREPTQRQGQGTLSHKTEEERRVWAPEGKYEWQEGQNVRGWRERGDKKEGEKGFGDSGSWCFSWCWELYNWYFFCKKNIIHKNTLAVPLIKDF